MVKTHKASRFTLRSIEEICDAVDVILQIEPTGRQFKATGKDAYLCEVVPTVAYGRNVADEVLTAKLISANEDIVRLRMRNKQLEAELKKARKAT